MKLINLVQLPTFAVICSIWVTLICTFTTVSAQSQVAEVEKLVIREDFSIPENDTSYVMNGAFLRGDTLYVQVTYFAGKKKNYFSLYTTGRVLRSTPPQLNLFMEKYGKESRGIDKVDVSLRFDISAIRTQGWDEIILHVFPSNEVLKYE